MKKKVLLACMVSMMAMSLCACGEVEEDVKEDAEIVENNVEEAAAAAEQDVKDIKDDIEDNAKEASDAAKAMDSWDEEQAEEEKEAK